jgi:hypothetical protein
MRKFILLLVLVILAFACSQKKLVTQKTQIPVQEQVTIPSANCGNGICEESEVQNCPGDCGSIETREPTSSICGNGICESVEVNDCPIDCAPINNNVPPKTSCGNGLCEGEEVNNCPKDCG